MQGVSPRLCVLLTTLVSCSIAWVDAAVTTTSSSTAPVLHIEASPVQSIPLVAYDDDSTDVFTYYDDSDDDSDDDIDIASMTRRSRDPQNQQQQGRFTSARQWHVYPASGGGINGDGTSWYPGDGTLQLELEIPGRVFVHVLKDDPDYDAERKKLKHGDNGSNSMYLSAKVVAMANDSALLNTISVVEGPQGWSVVFKGQTSKHLMDELVVFVYLDAENGVHLGSIVSKGAGDVVVTKKAMSRNAVAFTVSSQSSGGGVYLLANDAPKLVSLTLEVVGSSNLYLRFPSSVSIAGKLIMTVDGSGSITVKSEHTSTTQLASRVSGGGDICFAASRLQSSVLNATVAQNGSITICSERSSSSVENLKIDGVGMIDTGVVSSVRTSVDISGGPADVTIGSAISLEYWAPPSSHVWYRGSRPIFVSKTASGTVSPVLLKKQSAPRTNKCRAVTVPSEPQAVSLIEKGASASPSASITITTTTTATSPSAPKEKALSPAAIQALEDEHDPDNIMKILFPHATELVPSSAHTGGTLNNGDGPMLESASPMPSTPRFEFLEPTADVPPAPAPPPITIWTPPSEPPPPPAPVSTNAATLPGSTATAPTFTDIVLILGVAFVAFTWLLHLALQCCDQHSRRRYYQLINSDRPGSSAATPHDDEDPPVLI